MFFRNIFLSLFLVFVLGFALVQAESKEPRGPKITNKVSIMDIFSGHFVVFWYCCEQLLTGSHRSTLIFSMEMNLLAAL